MDGGMEEVGFEVGHIKGPKGPGGKTDSGKRRHRSNGGRSIRGACLGRPQVSQRDQQSSKVSSVKSCQQDRKQTELAEQRVSRSGRRGVSVD